MRPLSHVVMSEEQGGADAGGAGGGATEAPGTDGDPGAAAKADTSTASSDLRARLAEAKAKRVSQVEELQRALEQQNATMAELQKKLVELESGRAKDKADAEAAGRIAKIGEAIANAKVKPKYREFALSKLSTLDTSKAGWEGQVDEWVAKHADIVERQAAAAPKTDWAKTTAQALGERAKRTLLGSMSSDQVIELQSRRGG